MDALSMVALAKASKGGGGKKTYAHVISSKDSSNRYCYLTIFNDKSTDLTASEISKYLYDNGFTNSEKGYPCTGISGTYVCVCIYSNNGSNIVLGQGGNTFSIGISIKKQLTFEI